MNLISWIIFGFIVGAIARFLVPGTQEKGCLGTIALGVLGSLLGGAAAKLLGRDGPLEPAGWILSIIGAVVLLILVTRNQKKIT